MYKIAICEDDVRYIQILKRVILETQEVDACHTQFFDFTSGKTA